MEVDEAFQKRGYFSLFVQIMKKIAIERARVLQVESVVNPFLGKWLLAHGFEMQNPEDTLNENYVFNV